MEMNESTLRNATIACQIWSENATPKAVKGFWPVYDMANEAKSETPRTMLAITWGVEVGMFIPHPSNPDVYCLNGDKGEAAFQLWNNRLAKHYNSHKNDEGKTAPMATVDEPPAAMPVKTEAEGTAELRAQIAFLADRIAELSAIAGMGRIRKAHAFECSHEHAENKFAFTLLDEKGDKFAAMHLDLEALLRLMDYCAQGVRALVTVNAALTAGMIEEIKRGTPGNAVQ